MKKVIILFALMLTGCVEAKEEIVCNTTIEYIEVIKYVEVDNIIIETEYIEKLVKVPYEVIKEVIVEVPVEVIVYETITKTKYVDKIQYVYQVEYITEYVEKNSIVMLGDSLTESLILPQIVGTSIFNQGIWGDRTIDLLDRLDDVILLNPDVIYLMVGINDLGWGYSVADVIDNYNLIVDTLKTELPNVVIYLQSVLPITENSYYPNYESINNKVLELNEELQTVTTSGLQYIDLHSLYVDDNGYMNNVYTIDGVHLTELGYSIWLDELSKYGF
jgi:lysophospholipase L1-like esterase